MKEMNIEEMEKVAAGIRTKMLNAAEKAEYKMWKDILY